MRQPPPAVHLGDKITVLVRSNTGKFIRFVRWTAQYN